MGRQVSASSIRESHLPTSATGYWNYETSAPGEYPGFFYGTEIFKTNTKLLSRVLELSSGVNLTDSDTAKAFRSMYPYAPMNQPPTVVQGDRAASLTSDTYFAGQLLGDAFGNLTTLLTNGTGDYIMTAQCARLRKTRHR
jgi:purine nucleoside permease